MTIPVILTVLLGVVVHTLSQEILLNADFEGEFTGNWICQEGCTFTRTRDAYSGVMSVMVSDRQFSYSSAAQDVFLENGGYYRFSIYIKLLNMAGEKFHKPEVWRQQHFRNGQKTWMSAAKQPLMTVADGWQELSGAFRLPASGLEKVTLYIQIATPGVNYLLDKASLVKINEINPDWKTEALQRIEQTRKSDIVLNMQLSSYNPNEIEVEVKQTSSKFGFGSGVAMDVIDIPTYQPYWDYFYNTFEWATPQNEMKWLEMEKTRGVVNYQTANRGVEVLLNNGIKVRGHNIYWGVKQYQPKWLQTLSVPELKQEMQKRLQSIVNMYKDKVLHWDVNNENLNWGDWYEERTGELNITKQMHLDVYNLDKKNKLMMNEYFILYAGQLTEAYVKRINDFKSSGIPLHAVGVQGHLPGGDPDMTAIKYNIDRVASTGVPIWITELTTISNDSLSKAQWFDDILTLFYSHPGIEGVMFWQVYDERKNYDILKQGENFRSNLIDSNFQVNAAGKRVQELIQNVWKTQRTIKPTQSGQTVSFRGYQGDYMVTVRHLGSVIHEETFSLDVGGSRVTIDLGNQGGPATSVPSRPNNDPVTGSGLSCITRWSDYSAKGDDKSVQVSCDPGEVMTGCSSYSETDLEVPEEGRDGEKILLSNGVWQCNAVNGHLATGRTQAVARCCSGPNLQCSYETSAVSGKGAKDTVEAGCDPGMVVTGCSTYTWYAAMNGVVPDVSGKLCRAYNDAKGDGAFGGVYSISSCCKAAPSLQCQTRYSQSVSNGDVGDNVSITCGEGWTMTGCNFFTETGGSAGAYISDPYCIAVNGRQRTNLGEGVRAVAVCCRIVS